MKKILLLSTSFPSKDPSLKDGKKGGGDFLESETDALCLAGFTVHVFVPSKRGLPKRESYGNLTIKRFDYPFMKLGQSYKQRPIHDKFSIGNLVSIISMFITYSVLTCFEIRNNKIDLIWANWLQLGLVGKIGSFLFGVKMLATIRGSDVRKSSHKVINLLSKIAPFIFNPFTNDDEINGWIKKYRFKSIEVPAVYKKAQVVRCHSANYNILVIGRMDGDESLFKYKGLGERLFDFFKNYLPQNEQINVYIIGSGSALGKYKSIVQGVENITFCGWLNDYTEHLASADAVMGGGATNGVILSSVPHEIVPIMTNLLAGKLWKNHINSMTFDYKNINELEACIDFLIEDKERSKLIGKTAANDLKKYALPVEEAAQFWGNAVNQFIDKGILYDWKTAVKINQDDALGKSINRPHEIN